MAKKPEVAFTVSYQGEIIVVVFTDRSVKAIPDRDGLPVAYWLHCTGDFAVRWVGEWLFVGDFENKRPQMVVTQMPEPPELRLPADSPLLQWDD